MALTVHAIVCVEVAINVRKRDIAEMKVLDKAEGLEIRDELNEARLQQRRNNGYAVHIFSGHRVVIERACRAVQIPFAGLIQRFEHIREIVAEMRLPGIDGADMGAMETDGAAFRDDLRNAMDRRCPGAEQDNIAVREIRPARINVAGVIPQGLPGISAGLAALCAQRFLAPVRRACA